MPEIKVQHQCASKSDLVLTETFGEAIGPMPVSYTHLRAHET